MKKLFMPYYALVVTGGLLIAANIFLLNSADFEVNTLFVVLFLMANLSESVFHFFTQNVTITLSSAITIFAVLVLPLPSVILIIFGFSLLNRLSGYIRKDYKKILNMKWLFNFCTYIILVKMASFLFEAFDFYFLSTIDQIFALIAVCALYNALNILVTYTVISLSLGENAFKKLTGNEYIVFVFYNFMFSALLWFGYESYKLQGLVFMAILLVPLQKSIIMQSKSEEIKHKLTADGLTGAKNRQSFEDAVYEKLDKRMAFSLIFLDLDGFKAINDTYGHLTGDEVLADFVTRVKVFLRPDDHIYRYGGDEFCIITYDTSYGSILHNLLEKNKKHFQVEVGNRLVPYKFSMSLVEYDGKEAESYRSLMIKADKAMYQRKQVVK